MFRPIQRNELLIDIFLKWSTWKPNECRDNHLCFKMDEFLHAGLCHIKVIMFMYIIEMKNPIDCCFFTLSNLDDVGIILSIGVQHPRKSTKMGWWNLWTTT